VLTLRERNNENARSAEKNSGFCDTIEKNGDGENVSFADATRLRSLSPTKVKLLDESLIIE